MNFTCRMAGVFEVVYDGQTYRWDSNPCLSIILDIIFLLQHIDLNKMEVFERDAFLLCHRKEEQVGREEVNATS